MADDQTNGLIDPSTFPKLDPGKVRTAAGQVRGFGSSTKTETDQAQHSWAGLRGNYNAPEQETVLGLLGPAVADASTMDTNTSDAESALNTLADDLDTEKASIETLATDADAFRKMAEKGVKKYTFPGGVFGPRIENPIDGPLPNLPDVPFLVETVPWNNSETMIRANRRYYGRLEQIVANILNAETRCANKIRREIDYGLFPPGTFPDGYIDPATGRPKDLPENITKQDVRGMDNDSWGKPGEYQTRGCRDSVSHGSSNFLLGGIEGILTLVGYDPGSVSFGNGNVAAQAWLGLGDLVGSLLVVAAVPPPIMTGIRAANAAGVDDPVVDWIGERDRTVNTAVAGMVGIDLNAEDPFHRWKDDAVATGTESVLNVASIFIPGPKGGTAVLGSTRAGRVISETVDAAVPGLGRAFEGVIDAARLGGKVDIDIPMPSRAPDLPVTPRPGAFDAPAPSPSNTFPSPGGFDAPQVPRTPDGGSYSVPDVPPARTEPAPAPSSGAPSGTGAEVPSPTRGDSPAGGTTTEPSVQNQSSAPDSHTPATGGDAGSPPDAKPSEPTASSQVSEPLNDGRPADGGTSSRDGGASDSGSTTHGGSPAERPDAPESTSEPATRPADSDAPTHKDPVEFTNRDGSTMTSHPDGGASVTTSKDTVSVNVDGSVDIETKGSNKSTSETVHVHADGSVDAPVRQGTGTVRPPSIEAHPDGSLSVTTADGHVVTRGADGTVTQQHPNGSTTVRPTDGSIDANVFDDTRTVTNTDGTSVQNRADGSVVTRTPDGGSQTVRPDGSTFAHDAAGNASSTRPDGSSTKVSDGATTIRHADGSETTIARDGTVQNTHPDVESRTEPRADGGHTTTTTHPDRTTTTTQVDADGRASTTTTHPDGSRTTVTPNDTVRDTVTHPDGSTSTTYPDGSVMDAHPDGTPVTYGDPRLADGSAPGSVDNAGPDVPVSENGTRNGALVDGQPVSPELQELIDRPDSPVEVVDGEIRLREGVTVDFDLPETAEAGRQLGLQDANINELTLDQMMQNRELYSQLRVDAAEADRLRREAASLNQTKPGSPRLDEIADRLDTLRTSERALETTGSYRRTSINARIAELRAEFPDMSQAEARARATGEVAGSPALHGTDRISGGNHTNFSGFEDSVAGSSINSAIGRQWGQGRAQEMMSDLIAKYWELDIPPELWGDIRVNVDLTSNGASWRP